MLQFNEKERTKKKKKKQLQDWEAREAITALSIEKIEVGWAQTAGSLHHKRVKVKVIRDIASKKGSFTLLTLSTEKQSRQQPLWMRRRGGSY